MRMRSSWRGLLPMSPSDTYSSYWGRTLLEVPSRLPDCHAMRDSSGYSESTTTPANSIPRSPTTMYNRATLQTPNEPPAATPPPLIDPSYSASDYRHAPDPYDAGRGTPERQSDDG